MRQKIADQVQRYLPAGWIVRAGVGDPPWWLVTAPDGQCRSLMGLGRLSSLQLENRVRGMVSRFHLGAQVKARDNVVFARPGASDRAIGEPLTKVIDQLQHNL